MTELTFGLTIVRHGETQYNKDGFLQGQAIDSPLSEIGLRQAEAAGLYLKDVEFTNVFVSDMLRAQQTAETIMKHNRSCCGLEMVCDPSLKERSFGIAEGRPVQNMRDMAKAAGQSPQDFTPPGGESQEQVKERVKEFLQLMVQRMAADHLPNKSRNEASTTAESEMSPLEGKADDGVKRIPVHALVVTHGVLIRVALRYFVKELQCPLPLGSDEAHMFSLCPNTGLCRFVVTVKKDGDVVGFSRFRPVFVHRGDHVRN